MEIHTKLKESLLAVIGAKDLNLWFGQELRWSLDDDVVTLQATNPFFAQWLTTKCSHRIQQGIRPVFDHDVTVCFSTSSDGSEPPAAPQPRVEEPAPPAASKEKAKPTHPLYSDQSFANYVEGSSNTLAFRAARKAVQEPGEVSPILIYGPSGTGKTHLLEAMVREIKSKQSHRKFLYFTADDFTSQFVVAVRPGSEDTVEDFRRRLARADIILIDDLQLLASRAQTQVELLHLIDAATKSGQQLVFTLNAAANDVKGFSQPLLGRLEIALPCLITRTDQLTRLKLTRTMAERRGLRLSGDVISWLATYVAHSGRLLAGALCRLAAFNEFLEKPVTLPLVKQTLSDLAHSGTTTTSFSLREIESVICREFDLDVESLRSPSRARRIATARMLAMWFARKYTAAALTEIGSHFGKRSHSTVVAAEKSIEKSRQKDALLCTGKRIEETISHVEKMLMG